MAIFQDLCADLRVIATDGCLAVPEISPDERCNQPTPNLHGQSAASIRSPAPILVAGRRSTQRLSTLAAEIHNPVWASCFPTLRPKHTSILCDDEIPDRKGSGRQYPARFGGRVDAAGNRRCCRDALAFGVGESASGNSAVADCAWR